VKKAASYRATGGLATLVEVQDRERRISVGESDVPAEVAQPSPANGTPHPSFPKLPASRAPARVPENARKVVRRRRHGFDCIDGSLAC
jgi:hypothetical protein